MALEPLLRGREPLPTRHLSSEINLAPLRMPTRRQEVVEFREKRVDETGNALVALALFWPVESPQDRAYRECVYRVPSGNQPRIIFMPQGGREVFVGKRVDIRHR